MNFQLFTVQDFVWSHVPPKKKVIPKSVKPYPPVNDHISHLSKFGKSSTQKCRRWDRGHVIVARGVTEKSTTGSTISTNRYMIKSTLKVARYCPLVIQGFSNFLGLFQVIMANPVDEDFRIFGFIDGFSIPSPDCREIPSLRTQVIDNSLSQAG